MSSASLSHDVAMKWLGDNGLSLALFSLFAFDIAGHGFLSTTGVLVVLAIFLRERGPPESKPIGAPHAKMGAE